MPTDKGANADRKVGSLVAGMVVGADSIADMAILRHGAMNTGTQRRAKMAAAATNALYSEQVKEAAAKHVFISYVREDNEHVDKLCKLLEAAKIPYWRDRKDLGPGDAWKKKIRDAIQSGTAVFVACFSGRQRGKGPSYMNEEMTLAVEQFRLRPPNKTWLIPVRFDDGEIDEWELGAGRWLSDFNYADLFGDDYAANAVTLIASINDVLGGAAPDSTTVRASIEEAEASERPEMLKRLTKQLLLDPAKQIELDELLADEARRLLALLSDDKRFPATVTAGASDKGLELYLAEIASDYWTAVEPFCWSLQVAARYARSNDQLTLWADTLRALHSYATAPVGGNTAVLKLRFIPLMAAVITCAVATAGVGQMTNFRALLVDVTVSPQRYGTTAAVPIGNAVSYYTPFEDAGATVASIVALAARDTYDLATATAARQENKIPNLRKPVADWMFEVLRPAFADQFIDTTTYAQAFDKGEIMLGIFSQDAESQIAEANGYKWANNSSWFGRSTWRSDQAGQSPVEEFARELATAGPDWPPLRVGLFGANVDRASAAIATYSVDFDKVRSQDRFR